MNNALEHVLDRSLPLTVWDIHIRRAGTLDILMIHALAHRIWQNHYPALLPEMQINYMLELMYAPQALHEQMMRGHEFWIIEAANIPVGYASLSEKSEGHWHLHKLYINTDKQRLGLGKSMLEHLQKLYTPKTLSVDVFKENYTAINFYFQNGFTIAGNKKTDIGGGFVMDDLVMTKNIAAN